MSYQFSIWLDEKTAKDLDALSRFEERKRGAMIKVLIRRAAKEQQTQADPNPARIKTLPPMSAQEIKQSEGGKQC